MGQVEKLGDLLVRLYNFAGDYTIYAIEPWTEHSEAIVAREPDSGGLPKEASNFGMKYMLEVGIARDFIEDWIGSLEYVPSSSEVCQRLIDYAINDA